ncbi:Hypothetical predicted protein [Pelobates cultripes]|uniref:Uncharacterized protein n=1 Tax=Pelobates cultripes TaxID=61616 RepID=A0AAD1WCC5_PELCU|nr:Hypothetical predicted protein [Pelobates cultripes]
MAIVYHGGMADPPRNQVTEVTASMRQMNDRLESLEAHNCPSSQHTYGIEELLSHNRNSHNWPSKNTHTAMTELTAYIEVHVRSPPHKLVQAYNVGGFRHFLPHQNNVTIPSFAYSILTCKNTGSLCMDLPSTTTSQGGHEVLIQYYPTNNAYLS